jgi:uncharacterized protein (UPF0261 family)
MASAPSEKSRPTVALIGFLDTKGEESAFLHKLLKEAGSDVVVIDVSITVSK